MARREGFLVQDYSDRFYDPTLGRFIQPDSIIPNLAGPQTWNGYSYVENSPILLSDPSGNFGKCNAKMSGYLCKVRQRKAGELEDEWRQASHKGIPQTLAIPMEWGIECVIYSCSSTISSNGISNGGLLNGDTWWTDDQVAQLLYEGVIPANLQAQMIAKGADPYLLDQVTLTIYGAPTAWGTCASPKYAGNTIGTHVEICSGDYFDYTRPSGTFVHELIHVRQYLDSPVGSSLGYVWDWALLTISHYGDDGYIHDHNPYEGEAMSCEGAVRQTYTSGSGLPPLNSAPCILTLP